MIRLLLIFAVSGLINLNCNTSDFNKYIQKIEKINLPIENSCGLELEMIPLDIFTKYELISIRQKGCYIYGKIEKDKFVSILYGIPGNSNMPFLINYSLNGEKIDSLELFNTSCDSDAWSDYLTEFRIDEDLKITIQDTYKEFELDSVENRIDESANIKIEINKYTIEGNGKFKKIN